MSRTQRWLRLVSQLLSIPTALADATTYRRADYATGDMALAAAGSLATWFRDQASVRTAAQLLSFGSDPAGNPERTFESVFGQIAGGMASPAFVCTLGVDTTDPYTRMRDGWEDYVKASIPGLSPELEPLRNVFGEPVNRANNSLAEALLPVSMAPVASWTKEPELDELSRLYHHTGYAVMTDPGAVLGRWSDPRELKLEDGVSLYSHLLKARATFKLPAATGDARDGLTLKEAVGELINSPEYAEAVDADAGRAFTSQGEPTRGYMISKLFSAYNKAIKAEVAASSPIALKWMVAARCKDTDDAHLSGVPIEELVRNPDLYRANGIDPQPFADRITEGASPAGQLLNALDGSAPAGDDAGGGGQ